MDDLISRSELVEKAEILYQHTSSGKIIPWLAVRVCDINNVSTIEAEPVRHGEWIHLGGDDWCCSKCGEVIHTEGSWEHPDRKFCYECGAKLKGR